MPILTPTAQKNLISEEKRLKIERVKAVIELKKAREMGDLSENGFYKGAKAKLSSLDRRLRQIHNILIKAKIAKNSSPDSISIGSTVTVKRGNIEEIFVIVGDFEAEPFAKKISHKSPVGSAFIGKKKGDKVKVTTPQGDKEYLVIDIKL